jgi:hypothetical protein
MYYLIIFSWCLLLSMGCQKNSHERQYEQIMIDAPLSSGPIMANPHGSMDMNIAESMKMETPVSNLQWTVPEGWREIPGGGMRVVSFVRADNDKTIDVSIVSSSGAAGGLEANLIRWGNQLGISLSQESPELGQLIQNAELAKTAGGIETKLFDFSRLQDHSDETQKSMVAAMIQFPDATVFVKMTGSKKSVAANLDSFKALTQSVGQK